MYNCCSVSACDKSFDLTIVIENSGNIGETQFKKVKTFAKQFVDAFDVRDGGTHVAVVSYGSRPAIHTLFNSFSGPALNKKIINDRIDEIEYQRDSVVSLGSTLSEVLDTVYADGNGARNGTNKVIFLCDIEQYMI